MDYVTGAWIFNHQTSIRQITNHRERGRDQTRIMEVLKNLHVSIAETCEKSFDTAYQDLQSQINNLQKRAEEAETKAAAAFAGQQAAEEANKGLQSNIYALQEQLRHFETKPEDLDLPKQFARLEDDFAPEHVWTKARRPGSGSGRDSYSREELKEILENKYATLYANIQTLTDGWSTLKSKVLQHKKKLRHVDRQLAKNEFTLVLNGVPVTFRRTGIANANLENDDYVPVSFNETITNPATSFTSTSTTTPANQIQGAGTGTGAATSVHIKREPQSQIDLTQHSDPEPAPAAENQLSAEPRSSQVSPDALHPPPLPSIRNRKRKRVLAADDNKPTEIVPERSPPRKIKNEPVSSSPSRHSIQPSEQHFPSTQDLEHISYVVQTPTKPKPKPKPQRMDFDGIQEEEEEEIEPEPVSRNKEQKRPDNRAHSRAQSSASVLNPVNGNSQGRQSTTAPNDKKKKVKNQRHQNNPSARETPNTRRASHDRNMTQSSQSQPDITADSYPTIHPEEEPYRLLPLHMLTLSHFKINPAGNQGMDYAYSNVVRKKEERKCLSGCTRPGCCGDRFRAMARLGGIPSGSEEENNLILEEYLGEEGQRHRIERLSVEERNRLLVEAKARKFANQYGKHRHAHQRARTPPGFWRTDMPDTQELEADALDAERFEREKVEERYREAMRPGGLWTWADE